MSNTNKRLENIIHVDAFAENGITCNFNTSNLEAPLNRNSDLSYNILFTETDPSPKDYEDTILDIATQITEHKKEYRIKVDNITIDSESDNYHALKKQIGETSKTAHKAAYMVEIPSNILAAAVGIPTAIKGLTAPIHIGTYVNEKLYENYHGDNIPLGTLAIGGCSVITGLILGMAGGALAAYCTKKATEKVAGLIPYIKDNKKHIDNAEVLYLMDKK